MQWPQRLLTLCMAFRKIVSPFAPNSLMCLRAVGLSQGAPSLPPWSQHLPSIPLDQELFPQIQVIFVRNANKTFPHLLDSRFLFLGCLQNPPGVKPPRKSGGRGAECWEKEEELLALGQFCSVLCSETQAVP